MDSMGLDITAYRKLTEVRPSSGPDDGWDEGLTDFYANGDFPGRFGTVLKEDALYRAEETHEFRAGSYSGYSAWRAWLAGLVDTTPDDAWEYEYVGPFAELINFSDCEGTIADAATCAKLAKDFAEWDDGAKADDTNDGYNYSRYREWRKAFEMAADGGAVKFH